MSNTAYDFSGWATRYNLRCSDGRIIRKGAFKDCDGTTVTLVWNHDHDDVSSILGHAVLENRENGVYAYCAFNDSDEAKAAKIRVDNGDIESLSIYANQLKQNGPDVVHGAIREVSLVIAGANPGAFIDSVMSHSDESDEEAIIYTGEEISLAHSDNNTPNEDSSNKEEEKTVANSKKTVDEVFNTLTDEQKEAVAAIVDEIVNGESDEEDDSDYEDDEEGGSEEMKHNVFEGDAMTGNYISHSDMQDIFADARKNGSLRDAVERSMEDGALAHAGIPTDGMTVGSGSQTYGVKTADMLFPDARAINVVPDFIKRDMTWVEKVMNSTHHTPFSRVKSVYANITEDEARAKGYIKGKMKKEEVFSLLKRTTDPQTIYKKQKLDRDDIMDITDFDVAAWIKGEMRMMLEEEIARAILIGDGRLSSDDDKISEDHVRSVLNDKPLFSVPVEVEQVTGDAGKSTKNFMDSCIRARKEYKGSGNPTLFTTEDQLTEMLLLEDTIGHKLYKSVEEVATALRVKEIVTVEPMEGAKNAAGNAVLGIIVNLTDYNIGADKGGETSLFDDFDIDFNQYKYLLETRCSGALTKPFSALVFTAKASG